MRILLVEDDKTVSDYLCQCLFDNRYIVDTASTVNQASEYASFQDYDLAILDIMLPDGSGLSVCRDLRIQNPSTAIILLTAKNRIKDLVAGLDSGADDYLTKPFSRSELLARIRALLRRKNGVSQPPEIKIEDLVINTNTCRVFRENKEIFLSPKEYALLEYLALNRCRVVAREDLLAHVWGEYINPLSNTVDVHIRYLRKKIDDCSNIKLIRTIKGKGYLICCQVKEN